MMLSLNSEFFIKFVQVCTLSALVDGWPGIHPKLARTASTSASLAASV